MDWINRLFSSSGFVPHGFCYTWNPYVIWLNGASDALIALAYYTIPLTLVYFVRRRRDLAFHWMFLGFALFIVACGTTHVIELWKPPERWRMKIGTKHDDQKDAKQCYHFIPSSCLAAGS